MSKKIFINGIESYVGWALLDEFLGEKPTEPENEIYGTYLFKDDSHKPVGIKKMFKVIQSLM